MRISDWSSDVCSSDLRAFLVSAGFPKAGVTEEAATSLPVVRSGPPVPSKGSTTRVATVMPLSVCPRDGRTASGRRLHNGGAPGPATAHLGRRYLRETPMTDRVREFLRTTRPEGPCLVVDLEEEHGRESCRERVCQYV